MSPADDKREQELFFTVASVWREERVSCPHPDILNAHLAGGLDAASREITPSIRACVTAIAETCPISS